MIEKVITETTLETGRLRITPGEAMSLGLPEHQSSIQIEFEGSSFNATWQSASGFLSGDAFAERLQEYCQIRGLLRLRRVEHGLAMETVGPSQSSIGRPQWPRAGSERDRPELQPRPRVRRRRTTERKFRAADEFDWSSDGRVGFLKDARSAFLSSFTAGGFDSPHLVRLRIEGERLATLDGFEELLAIDVSNVDHMPHQEAVAAQVLSRMRGRAVLADEVGLGKTIEAGLVLKELALRGLARRVLVLCPATLREQWRSEMASKFELDFDVAYGGPEIAGQERLILSLHLGARNLETLTETPWDVVVVDEAHRAAGQNARKTRELVQLLGRGSRYMLMLTATPVQNSLTELYRLVEMLRPGTLGSEREFMRRFVDRSDPRRPINPADLRRLVSSAMLRTTRSQAGVDRVRRRTTDVPITLGKAEAELYLLATDLLRSVMTRPTDAIRRRHLAHRLAGSPYAMGVTALNMAATMDDPRVAEILRRVGNMAMNIPKSAREQRLLELTQKWLNEHGRVLVFTQHTDTVQAIMRLFEQQGIPAVPFHGGLTPQGRTKAIDQFRSGTARVLVSTDAGAEGQNLQFCNCVINYDLPWNPMRIEQRIGRVDRLTQPRDEVFVANFFARNTIDEHVYRLLHDKLRMFELLFGQVTTILGELEDDKSFETRVLNALYSPTDGAMAKVLDDLGADLEQARELGQAMVGADQGLSSWLASSKDYRSELPGNSARELLPERAERERQRQRLVQGWVREVLQALGASVVHDVRDVGSFVTYELSDDLSAEMEGRRHLHLAFDRQGLDHHPEAELCTVGSPAFAELLGLLRERGDLHVAVSEPPADEPEALDHEHDVIERVATEWVSSGEWTGQAAFRLEVGDIELSEQMLEVSLPAAEPSLLPTRTLLPGAPVPPSLKRPRKLVHAIERAAEERARVARAAAQREIERLVAEERQRVMRQFDEGMESGGWDSGTRARMREARRAEETRLSKTPEVRARLELLALSVAEADAMLEETWRHLASGASFTTVRHPGRPHSLASAASGDRVERLSACRSGHVIDAAERQHCDSCDEDVCGACGADGSFKPCPLCGVRACGRCRTAYEGLCSDCKNIGRDATGDRDSMLCFRTPKGHSILLGSGAAIVETEAARRLVLPAADVDDEVRVRVREYAMSVGASPDAGFLVRTLDLPSHESDAEVIASRTVEYAHDVSIESAGGGDIDPEMVEFLDQLPPAPRVDVVSERGAGLERLLRRLRAGSPPPPAQAVVLTRVPRVTERGVIANGLFERFVTLEDRSRRVIEGAQVEWRTSSAGSAEATMPGLHATVHGVGNALVLSCRMPERDRRWSFVPDSSDLRIEHAWADFAEGAGRPGAEVWVVEEPPLTEISFARSSFARLEDRELVARWIPSEEVAFAARRPVTGDLEAGGLLPSETGMNLPALPGKLAEDLRQLISDRPVVRAALHRTARDVWEQHGRTEISYEVRPGQEPRLPLVDAATHSGSDFMVCSAGHLYVGPSGQCASCGEWRCLGCDESGPLHECKCRRQVCSTCRSVERRLVERHCRTCGTRSCSSCGADPGFVTCRGCQRIVCTGCLGPQQLCRACNSLERMEPQLVDRLPAPLGARGAAVWTSVDGNDRVIWMVAPHRRECAVVTSLGAIENWRSFASPQPEAFRRICLGHALRAGRQIELRQAEVAPRELWDGSFVTRQSPWHVGVRRGDAPWELVGSPLESPRDSLLEPLAQALGFVEVPLPPRTTDAMPESWPLDSGKDVDQVSYAAVRHATEVRLTEHGVVVIAGIGPDDATTSAPWSYSPSDVERLSSDWVPVPRLIASVTLEEVRAEVVQHGTALAVGVKWSQEPTRWFELHGDTSADDSALVTQWLNSEFAVGWAGPVTDPSLLQLTEMRGCSLISRRIEPRATPTSETVSGGLASLRRAWIPDATVQRPLLASLPPTARDELEKAHFQLRTWGAAVGADIVEEWLSLAGVAATVRYRLPPGQLVSFQLDDTTGLPSPHLWLDREGHKVAEPLTCPYCSAPTCKRCSAAVGPCRSCGIEVCGQCAGAGALHLCPACTHVGKPSSVSMASIRHLRKSTPLLVGSDALHRIEVERLPDGWTLRVWHGRATPTSLRLLDQEVTAHLDAALERVPRASTARSVDD